MDDATKDSPAPPDSSTPREGNPALPRVEAAHRRLVGTLDRCRRLYERESRLSRALEECQSRIDRCTRLRDQARAKLIREVVAADDRQDHSIEAWFLTDRPIWEARSGGRAYVLTPNSTGAMPSPDRPLEELVSLVVIDI